VIARRFGVSTIITPLALAARISAMRLAFPVVSSATQSSGPRLFARTSGS